jgi:hypothetical protein
VTLESSLPWVSVAAAVGAGVAGAGPASRLATGLKCLALGALAVFAYFRWIAPASIPLSLTLAAISPTLLPQTNRRLRMLGAILALSGWLVLANLFWGSGDGRLAVFTDAIKAGLLATLLVGVGLGLWRVWTGSPQLRVRSVVTAGALLTMAVMALTLDWGLWPALAGTAAIVASQALTFANEASRRLADRPLARRTVWAFDYLGHAAIAYAFLR